MQRIATLAAFAGLALASTSQAAETRNYDLPPFSKIDVSSGIKVVVAQNATQSVRVETDTADDFNALIIEVDNGRLVAKYDINPVDIILRGGLLNLLFDGNHHATVHIAVPSLSAIDVSSGAQLTAAAFNAAKLTIDTSSGARVDIQDLTTTTVALDLSSGSSIDIAGSCTTLTLELSSGASLSASSLICEDAKVGASSGSNATIFVSKQITGDLSSGAHLSLLGDPQTIDVSSSSGGRMSAR